MMNKLDYLREMERILKVRLNKKEVDEIMRDYAEYFVEGTRQGKTDHEIAYNLGDPREVANQIIAETLSSRQGEYQEPAPRPKKPPFWRRAAGAVQSTVSGLGKVSGCLVQVLLGLIGLCLLPFAVMGVLGVLALIGMVLLGLSGGVALLAGLLLLALCLLLGVLMCVGSLPITMVVLGILLCVAGVAGSVFGISLLLMLIRFIWNCLVWCSRRIYYGITKRPAPVYHPGEWKEPDPTAPLRNRAAKKSKTAAPEESAPIEEEEPAAEPFVVDIPEDAYMDVSASAEEPIVADENAQPQVELTVEPEEDLTEEIARWASPLQLPGEVEEPQRTEKEEREEEGPHA